MTNLRFSCTDAAATVQRQIDLALIATNGRYTQVNRNRACRELQDLNILLFEEDPEEFFQILRVARIACQELSGEQIARIRSLNQFLAAAV